MEPATAMLIAAAVSAAAKGAGQAISGNKATKASKRRAKEMERETKGEALHHGLQGSAEMEAHGTERKNKLAKRKTKSFHETADLVRGALNI